MKKIHIDIETYSSVDLGKSGVYRYAESDDFEIILFGYAVDDGDVKVVDLLSGEKIPEEIIEAIKDEKVIKTAHNAHFERVCLSRFILGKGKYLSPVSWQCTMIWAAYLGLPLSLKDVGTVLGLDKKKMEEGKELIKFFCTPCTPTKTNNQRTRNLPHNAPEKWMLFKKYNARDVEVEIGIEEKLKKFPVPDFVWDEYVIDQQINDRGVKIDLDLVRAAIEMDGKAREELSERMKDITELENPNSVVQMRKWLSENGLEMESLGKKEVAAAIKDCPERFREVLKLRQQLSKSSVKKYQTMENAVCSDGRARGMFQFYGANRTGRFAGRLIQMQNLPQNHLSDLKEARELVKSGDYEAVKMLYEDVTDTLSQLIRTAFVPEVGTFHVADFSAIEARVLSFLAGEEWRMEVFKEGGDIYCATASKMFHCKVEKNGENGELRQKGKQCELACIAEGSLVLTNHGLIPIEKVTTDDLLWDGEDWVKHEGVIFKGEREVITYEGLTATKDHLVWVQGQQKPIQFGLAASSGAHLVKTGDGGENIRLGEDNKPGKKMEQELEPLLCSDSVPRMQVNPVDGSKQSAKRQNKGMPELLSAETDTTLAGQKINCSKAEMRESNGSWLPQLWRKRNKVRFSKCEGSRAISHKRIWPSRSDNGNRQDRYQFRLRSGEPEICNAQNELCKPTQKCSIKIFSRILAILEISCNKKTVAGTIQGRNYKGCRNCGIREEKELANDKCTARLYDIRNAGRHHRFTVSNCLVHNCGYGGGVGAMKAMGAIEAGMAEEELKPLVDAWRQASPKIVKFWWDIDKATKEAVAKKSTTKVKSITFSYRSGFLFITLPSGRNLAYVKPRVEENDFGGTSITYEGTGTAKKWERLETYGPKIVENIVQGMSRDILCFAMKTLREKKICMHIHDELVIEGVEDQEEICRMMALTPPWAEGLCLRADGSEMEFYQKD